MHEIETPSAKFRAAPINSTHGGVVAFEVETTDADVALVRVMLSPLEAIAVANKLLESAKPLINRPPYSVLEHQPHPGATPLIQGFIPCVLLIATLFMNACTYSTAPAGGVARCDVYSGDTIYVTLGVDTIPSQLRICAGKRP